MKCTEASVSLSPSRPTHKNSLATDCLTKCRVDLHWLEIDPNLNCQAANEAHFNGDGANFKAIADRLNGRRWHQAQVVKVRIGVLLLGAAAAAAEQSSCIELSVRMSGEARGAGSSTA